MSGTRDDEPSRQPHRWRPGQSGNPKGRPRAGESVTAALRSRWPADAIAEHLSWLAVSGSSHEIRLRATLAIIERLEPQTKHLAIEATTRPMFDVSKLSEAKQREILALITPLLVSGDDEDAHDLEPALRDSSSEMP